MLGLRYPLAMLPLLYFELAWKAIRVLAFGIPLWSAGRLDPGTGETLNACLMGVVLFPLVIPWRYAFEHHLKARGDRWRTGGRSTTTGAPPARARQSISG